ncbi:hypothetical protein EUX98_g8889 [Antrodiella citrinella]|uniref:CxC2-like cysteine cluster KDZ transposase-associated domain-containing protein n=1 Tax=Antrodiella citrinella TaxID=2447956 RepID=A0A4S4M198_9APHY|nr:hypothetical protein EUX98_g8889 [Antrodiella citrinella]
MRNVQRAPIRRRKISIPAPESDVPTASTSQATPAEYEPMDLDPAGESSTSAQPRTKTRTRNRGVRPPDAQNPPFTATSVTVLATPSFVVKTVLPSRSPVKTVWSHYTDIFLFTEYNICFEKTSLAQLGVGVQLGHLPGTGPCSIPGRHVKDFAVCDLTGFHEVDVTFCACEHPDEGVIPFWIQLIRVGWFPGSREKPKTAFTLSVLDFFQQLNFQAKTNLSDFQRALSRYTDNSGRTFWNRRRPFAEAVRQYRHLVALKRGGRCHDPTGVDGTSAGALALECPACPHPGRNLPPQWNLVPMEMRWLYTLFLMVDANFKLKLKDRGIQDIELAPGWAYYVNESKFQAHIDEHHRKHGDGIEDNTCSAEHNAILKANLRKEGYIASGVGAVFCARHCLVRPNGVGDLQKGERYVNMDYLVLQTLALAVVSLVLLSYDIACQYSKKFRQRVKAFPPEMRLSEDIDVRFAIPKKHFVVHGANHSKYSLNYLQWVGRTYGEGVESAWHVFNSVSMATREMGPAMRHEVLNDHWGSWNWEKILNFGFLMTKSFVDAYEMKIKHASRFEEFNATFPTQTVNKWKRHLLRWKANPNIKPDPFEELETQTTLKEIQLKLAKEDADDTARGAVVQHEVSPSVFLHLGLEIEDQQRRLRSRAVGKHSASELVTLQEKRTTLGRRIELWRRIQNIYLPVAMPLYAADSASSGATPSSGLDDDLDDATSAEATKVEDVPLWLPSGLSPALRTADCIKTIAAKECELRKAQAFDALANIRRLRRVITGISVFKKLNLVNEGQRTSTRLRSYYDKFKTQIDHSAARYQAARAALLVLDPNGSWSVQLKVLRTEDIRGPTSDEDNNTKSLGQGRREVSWIWLVQHASPSVDGLENDFCEGMRVEWAKSQARAERWSEEVRLLQEEMRRVLEFLTWKASWWRAQAGQRADGSSMLKQGLAAYAEKEARVHEDLAKTFALRWYRILIFHKITPSWKTKYLSDVTEADLASTPDIRLLRGRSLTCEEDNDESDEGDEDEGDEDE